jgi:hypothetical protein
MITARRNFLIAAASALAASSLPTPGKTSVPAILDHILLGSRNLDEGIAFLEAQTGVRAASGGVHPGRGTQNALLSLGDRRYLEIIAPDPKQGTDVTPMFRGDLIAHLHSLTNPRLIGWAAHPGDLKAFAAKLRAAAIPFQGPTPGSRKRPDGRLLQWRTLNLQDDDSGLLPFFIECAADSPHPASDAPHGCRVVNFELSDPDIDKLRKSLVLLDLNVNAKQNEKKQIRATLASPKGDLSLTS